MARSLVASSWNVSARSSMPAALECLRRRLELREIFRRDRDEPANGVRPEAPTALGVVCIHDIERPECRLDRVPPALGGPPADGEVGLNVFQRQPAARPL